MPLIIPIDDPADARIGAYRNIRERDIVGRERLFVAEGKVVLEKLVPSRRYRALSVLIAAHRAHALKPLLDQLPAQTPVYSAAQPVLDAIAGFEMHRGILAIGERVETPKAERLLGSVAGSAVVLVLSAIANHDNMGGIFRNAAAFGADVVLLDPDCCDPLYRKAIRVSVGAALLVPWARLGRNEDPVELLSRFGFTPYALSPAGAKPLATVNPAERSAILLGAEGPGLAPALLERSVSVTIPMAGSFDSLNVATTSGIVLHHFTSVSRR